MSEKWDELWARDIPAIEREDWLYEVKAEGDAMIESIEKLHDRIIDWVLHHRAKSENATHWTDEWRHNLPSGAFQRVLAWIRKDLGLPPLEPLNPLSIEDKILEAS